MVNVIAARYRPDESFVAGTMGELLPAVRHRESGITVMRQLAFLPSPATIKRMMFKRYQDSAGGSEAVTGVNYGVGG
jgi:hypothetical protein